MTETKDVIRWMKETQDLTPEGIVDLERQKPSSIVALQQLYSMFSLKSGAEVLRDLWVPDQTGAKAARLQNAVDEVRAVSKKHEGCDITTDSIWLIQKFIRALSRQAFDWLHAAADSRSLGDYVDKPHVQTAMVIDKRIALLRCRKALDDVLRPRMTAMDKQKLLALADDPDVTAGEINATYHQCVDVYRAFPITNGDVEAAIQLATDADINGDPSDADEYRREFLRQFCAFAVTDEETAS